MLSAAAIDRRRSRPAGSAGWPSPCRLALALVLDTADGRLARLQGTSSAFGRWLDQVLDELADLALHAAIAWAAFGRDGRPIWLLLGIVYASGKYLFLIQSLLGDELEGPEHRPAAPARLRPVIGRNRVAAHGPRPADRARSPDRPCRRAVASLDRARARWAGSTSRSRLTRSTSRRGPWPVRSGRGCAMPEPRVSVLVVAKNEAHNLADCLAAASWADERVVVVDPASRDATLEIARREADVVAVRDFDDFASQRNAALALASGDWVLSVDADERVTPALAAEIRRVIADPATPVPRVPRADPERDPGPPVRAFPGRSTTSPCACSAAIPAAGSAWFTRRSSSTVASGSLQNALRHHTLPTCAGLSRQARPLHDAGSTGTGRIAAPLPHERPGAAAALDVLQALRLQARVSRRGRGLHVLCCSRAFRWRCGPGSTAS